MGRKLFTTLVFIYALILSVTLRAGNKILYYFNRPVNNNVSTTINAIDLNNSMGDTIVAYINRSKYTIDVAVYNFESSFSPIATAINNAYGRGIQIRWIYDGSSSNSGLPLLNSGINKLGSPTTGSYGIMHNKFLVIDANSSNPDDAIVLTGSFNWNASQFNNDYNNAVILQDSAIAHAYTAEFNHMWGGTGLTPNAGASKFGPDKSDLGRHHFTIEGKEVELYFSPSDGTNTQIQTAISSANTDLYFGMYTFTDNTNANMIVGKHTNGVYVAGINDSYSNSYSPYNTFMSALGANFKVYSGSGIYHNKFMIVDPSDKCSDPLVLTGSHNWSISANTKNDENTLIIHDDTAANIYYQSFYANFAVLGGTLQAVTGCPTNVPANTTMENTATIFPNPATRVFTISYQLRTPQNVSVDVYNTTGQKVTSIVNGFDMQSAGNHAYDCTINEAGMYFIRFATGSEYFTRSVFVTHR